MRRKGAGKTLVFLHGAGGSSDWLPFMETLSHSYDVIVPEHPGYGASDDPDWLERTEDLAYFYLDFLKALDPLTFTCWACPWAAGLRRNWQSATHPASLA
jgi:pimeloyl-ACP methyl ester carboxylesterase